MYRNELQDLVKAGKYQEAAEREREIVEKLNAIPEERTLQECHFYDNNGHHKKVIEFVTVVRGYNPCYDRVMQPVNSFDEYLGPMFDGDYYYAASGEKLKVMNRFESQEVYDALSR